MAAFTPSGVALILKGFSPYLSKLDKVDKAQQGLGSSAGKIGKGFSSLGGKVLRFGANLASVAVGGVAALTAGLVAFGASAIKEGSAYTKAMSNVKAITGATATEFDALSTSAEELGRTTKFTAIEAAKGMGFLAMAGFEVNEVISAMPGVLNLAAAGNLELGQSADIVSNILTGFGAEADQTGRFVDVLTKTFTSSNTNLTQLGQAMKFVAPVAADLGLSVEQTAAAMGVLGDGGIQASMAGTTLRTTLLNLAAPVGKGKALLEELGIEIFNARGEMLPFPEVIGNFNEGMEGMSDAQKTATLRTIIGKRAISGFSLLLKKGEVGLETFGQELLDSGGTAAEIAATQLDNLSGDVTLFKSVLSGVKIDVFKALEPILRSVAKEGKGLLETFGPKLVSVFGALSAGIEKATDIVKNLITEFQKGGLFGGGAGSFGGAGLLAALGIPPDFRAIIENVFNTINEVIAGFQEGGVGGAFGALFSSESAESALQGVIDFISQFLTDNWPAVAEVLETWADNFFSWVNETVIPAIPGVLSGIVEAITTWASEQLPVIQEAMQQWKEGFWDWVEVVISEAGEFLAGIIATIGLWVSSSETQSQLTEFGAVIGETLVESLIEGMKNLAENTERLTEILTQIVTGLAIGVAVVVGLLIAVGAQIVAGILSGILEQLGIDLEPTTLSELGAILKGIGQNMLTAAKLIGENIITGITDGIASFQQSLEDKLTEVIQGGINAITSFLGIASPSTLFFDMGIDLIQGFIDGILSLAGTVTETLGTLVGGLLGGGEAEAQAPTLDFDPSEMLAGLELVKAGIAEISDVNLPAFLAATVATMTAVVTQWMLFIGSVTQTISLILELYTVHLPTLGEVSATTTQSIVDGFLMVIATIMQTIVIVNELIAAMQKLGAETKKVTDLMVKGFKEAAKALEAVVEAVEDAAKAIEDKLLEALKQATDAANSLGSALADATTAAGGLGNALAAEAGLGLNGGTGFKSGIGFQQGTLGFPVPQGFPNDEFMIGVSSGEEILVAPATTSIDQIVADSFGMGGQTTVINLNGTVINTPMDEAMLVELIRRTIAEDTR